MNSEQISVIAYIEIKPGAEEAFRKELDAISQGLAPLLRRHIRGQQWKLFFSRGHIFRKRRDKIRELKKLLSILDGRKP